jgi:hypothetical protein
MALKIIALLWKPLKIGMLNVLEALFKFNLIEVQILTNELFDRLKF